MPARVAASIIAAPSAVKPLVMPAYDIFIAEAAPIGPGCIGMLQPVFRQFRDARRGLAGQIDLGALAYPGFGGPPMMPPSTKVAPVSSTTRAMRSTVAGLSALQST